MCALKKKKKKILFSREMNDKVFDSILTKRPSDCTEWDDEPLFWIAVPRSWSTKISATIVRRTTNEQSRAARSQLSYYLTQHAQHLFDR